MLNDMMQSLAPALYPVFRDQLFADLLPDRHHHLRLPDHRLAAAAADRHLHRPAAGAVRAAVRDGLHAGRPGAAGVLRRQLSDAARLRRADRRRQRGVSPRGLARRARGLRRAARLRAEPVPGRRQFRPVARAADGGVHRRAARPAFGARLHRARLRRDRAADARRPLARSRTPRPRKAARRTRRPSRRRARAVVGARWRCWWCCCSRRRSIWRASAATTRSI